MHAKYHVSIATGSNKANHSTAIGDLRWQQVVCHFVQLLRISNSIVWNQQRRCFRKFFQWKWWLRFIGISSINWSLRCVLHGRQIETRPKNVENKSGSNLIFVKTKYMIAETRINCLYLHQNNVHTYYNTVEHLK